MSPIFPLLYIFLLYLLHFLLFISPPSSSSSSTLGFKLEYLSRTGWECNCIKSIYMWCKVIGAKFLGKILNIMAVESHCIITQFFKNDKK